MLGEITKPLEGAMMQNQPGNPLLGRVHTARWKEANYLNVYSSSKGGNW